MTLNAKKRELGIDSLLPLEALKVRDFGSSRCPITATMKIPEKSSTSYPIYIEAPTFNVRKKRFVFILFNDTHIQRT